MTAKPDSERRLEIARAAMKRHEVALSVLAMGDASPFMTPEFKLQVAIAHERMKNYARKD